MRGVLGLQALQAFFCLGPQWRFFPTRPGCKYTNASGSAPLRAVAKRKAPVEFD